MTRRGSLTRLAGLSFGALLAISALAPAARAADPIKIGFGMALTGGLAPNGKAAVIAFQMWADEVNAKGGLLGRKVEFVHYDDQSNPSTVPGIYTKLLDIDKVDLIVSGYGTNLAAPAMPIVMQRGLLFIGLFAYALNENFKYPNYFTMFPAGPNPKVDFAQSFFELAVAQNPKPKTLAIVAMDGEFSLLSAEGAREHAKRHGLRIVYDRTYPPSTVDFTPIVRAIQATNPDVVFAATYPPDGANMVRAVSEVGLRTGLFGGSMAGLQFAAFKTHLGSGAQWGRELRVLRARTDAEVPGHRGVLEEVPGQGGRCEGRSTGLLSAAVRLCRDADPGSGDRRHKESRTQEAR